MACKLEVWWNKLKLHYWGASSLPPLALPRQGGSFQRVSAESICAYKTKLLTIPLPPTMAFCSPDMLRAEVLVGGVSSREVLRSWKSTKCSNIGEGQRCYFHRTRWDQGR